MQDRRVNEIVVQKMLEYCDKTEILIERFGSTYEKFAEDFAFQMSCGMCIIQIGELTTRLTEDFKERHSEIVWNKIKGLRNIYAHDYENLKLDKIWRTLIEDIPKLKEQLKKIFYEEA